MQNGSDSGHGEVESNPVDAPAGEITQMVRVKFWAWHVLCWNEYMFGIEHEGFVNSPAWYSEAMYQASAALQRSLCTRYGIAMDRNHIIHRAQRMAKPYLDRLDVEQLARRSIPLATTHTDPGQYWNWTYFMQLVTGSTSAGSTNAPPGLGNLLAQSRGGSGREHHQLRRRVTAPIRSPINGISQRHKDHRSATNMHVCVSGPASNLRPARALTP